VASIEALRQEVAKARSRGCTIGLVPTMGALHAGHASLLTTARSETGFVVASIFVNPAQFGPHEDFTRYPRPLAQDLEVCAAAGVDLVFVPDVGTMYAPGATTYVEVHGLQDVLEGASRPGHFRGVCTIVLKLFNLVEPDIAYFGQKDGQQARIIQQMVRDLDVPVQLRICPIIREPDGLALSSRNRYLTPQQRRHAVVLFQALEEARILIENGERDATRIREGMTARINATPGANLDYVAVVDAETLKPLTFVSGQILIPVAVRFGATRLIDNVLLTAGP
jgi:pantoate--beta-alanine ligase